MDFGSLLYEAQRNDQNAKEKKWYRTSFSPPKKLRSQDGELSNNIQKFLAKKEEEEKRRKEEAEAKKQALLELRSQDKKSFKRVQSMLKRTKSANKSVLDDTGDTLGPAIPGYSQPDEDDYGYVSKDVAAMYDKLVGKYAELPDEPKFSKSISKSSGDLRSTKDRVRAALIRSEEEKFLPRKRKRKSKNTTDDIDGNADESDEGEESDHQPDGTSSTASDGKKCNAKNQPAKKHRPVPSSKPALDFNTLLQLAAQKQHQPVMVQKSEDKEERPLTQKEKLEKQEFEEREARRAAGINRHPSKKVSVADRADVLSTNPIDVRKSSSTNSSSKPSSGWNKSNKPTSEEEDVNKQTVSSSDNKIINKISKLAGTSSGGSKSQYDTHIGNKLDINIRNKTSNLSGKQQFSSVKQNSNNHDNGSISGDSSRKLDIDRKSHHASNDKFHIPKKPSSDAIKSKSSTELSKYPSVKHNTMVKKSISNNNSDDDDDNIKRSKHVTDIGNRRSKHIIDDLFDDDDDDNDRKSKHVTVGDNHSRSKHVIDDDNRRNERTIDDDNRRSKHAIDDDNRRSKHAIDDDNRRSKHVINDDNRRSKHVIDDDNRRSKHVSDDDNRRSKYVINDDNRKSKHVIDDDNRKSKRVIDDDDDDNRRSKHTIDDKKSNVRENTIVKKQILSQKKEVVAESSQNNNNNKKNDITKDVGPLQKKMITSQNIDRKKVDSNRNTKDSAVLAAQRSGSNKDTFNKSEKPKIIERGNNDKQLYNTQTKPKESLTKISTTTGFKMPDSNKVARSIREESNKIDSRHKNISSDRNNKVNPYRRQMPPSTPLRNKKPLPPRRHIIESDEEYDSELDDFIDDSEDPNDYSKYISEIFGYDKSRYANVDDDDECMESNFSQLQKEEFISTKYGILEDLADIRQKKKERQKLLKKNGK